MKCKNKQLKTNNYLFKSIYFINFKSLTIMKKIYLFAAAALALASCTSDEYLGDPTADNPVNNDGAILFSPKRNVQTRADHTGYDAAFLLNNKFVVAGYKGGTIGTPGSVVTSKVFDHYNVEWVKNTAGTTASNTSDWEYVNKAVSDWNTAGSVQTVKYWDYSAGQYDFIAFSYGNATNVVTNAYAADKLYISAVTPSTATSNSDGAYKVGGTTENLDKFYIADLVTAYNPQDKATKVSAAPTMGDEVMLSFRKITAKARIAFYETVPGYSINDVEFYASDEATTTESAPTLYASSASGINHAGTYTVYFPTVNDKTLSDYNKAHVVFATAASGQSSVQTFPVLNYTREQTSPVAVSGPFLGETSSTATYGTGSAAKDGKGIYTVVLPNETAGALTLRVNYTLTSNDGSGETIKVWGAKAVIPAEYCQWKSNYAYTYIFKISDNTNGQTQALGKGPEGLTPITFDAVVVDDESTEQETITTVATPSITTYSPGVQPTANNEYLSGKDVYVMVSDKDNQGSVVNDLTTKAKLLVVTQNTGAAPISEATVMDALNMVESVAGDVTTGRNGIVLSRVYPETTVTSIPGVNGNDITTVTVGGSATAIAASNVTKFTTGAASTVYAYVYQFGTGTPSTYNTAVVLTAEPSDWNASDNVYYTDFACTQKANIDYADGTYYKLLTNNNNKYAVKVIKVQ